MSYHHSTHNHLYRHLIMTLLLLGSSSLGSLSALGATPPGTTIDNQATGSFIDPAISPTTAMPIESNPVSVTVAEVAGITIAANGIGGTPNPGATVYFSFTIVNVGNDPTQFWIPHLANISGNATQASKIEIIGYNLTGAAPVTIATPVVVPTGGGQTGSNGTVAGLLASNGGGILQPSGSVTVRVPVTINSSAVASDPITVRFGDTPVDLASTSTPPARLQNQIYAAGTNDVYTIDNPNSLEASAGAPVNGDAIGHRQEASAVQTGTVVVNAAISGTVFEDFNYGGGAGRNLVTSGNYPRPNATVELYSQTTGAFVASTLTNSSGLYTFANTNSGDYLVRVVNRTVTSTRTGYVNTLIPVQTFRVTASTGTPLEDPNRVGGEQPASKDTGAAALGAVLDPTSFTFTTAAGSATLGGQAESIAPVKVVSSSVTGIDFGYNFDTIVNTNDSGQGSLRQFIFNSNALQNTGLDQVANPSPAAGTTAVNPNPGEETTIFMIPAPALTANVAVIIPTTEFPAITDPYTTINGLTQTVNIGDRNTGQQGTGGIVGTDNLALDRVNKPEVQIVGNNTINHGLTVSAANTTIRGISIYGFGSNANNTDGNIIISNNVSSTTIEQNFLGTTATSFSDPSGRTRANNIFLNSGANNGIIQNNLIGYADYCGIFAVATTGWKVEHNEIRDNSFNDPVKDGVSFESGSSNNLIRGNLITSQGGNGVDSWNGAGTLSIENNTITGNGVGATGGLGETPGVRLYGTGNKVYRNIIANNYGAGVMVQAASQNNLISQNSIYGNGTPTATNGSVASGQIGIDLLKATENDSTGTSPYVTANDGVTDATAANNGTDYPVITTSTLINGLLTVKGYVGNTPSNTFANNTLEFFIAEGTNQNNGEVLFGDNRRKSHGEGKTYIGTCATDASSQFTCTFNNTTTVGLDPFNITATATDATGNTSEFSATPYKPANVNFVKRITAIKPAGTSGFVTTNPHSNTVLTTADNSNPLFPAGYILGATDGGRVQPGDELEYTVYYLNDGENAARSVQICDRLDSNLAFNSDTYATGKGIQLILGDRTTIDLTNANDPTTDRARFITTPTLDLLTQTNCHLPDTSNPSGTIAIDLTGSTGAPTLANLPGVVTAGTPNLPSYGQFKFTATVK